MRQTDGWGFEFTFSYILYPTRKLESGSEADGCSLGQSILPVNFVVAAHYYHQTELMYTEADGTEG